MSVLFRRRTQEPEPELDSSAPDPHEQRRIEETARRQERIARAQEALRAEVAAIRREKGT